jgi:hypothetical protein
MAAQAGQARAGRGLAPSWVAVALGGLVVALTIAGLVAVVSAGQSVGQVVRLATVLGAAPIGVLVAYRRPGLLFGWLVLGSGLFLAVGDGAAGYSELDFRLHHGMLPLGRLALALEPAFILGLVLITFSLWLFPDERLPSGRWRPVAWSLSAAGVAYGLVVFVPWVIAALTPQVRLDASGTPVAITHGVAGLIWGASLIGVLGLILSWVTWLAVQVPRYRRSVGERRQQLKWLYSGAFVFVIGLVVTIFQPGSSTVVQGIAAAVGAAGLSALPVALGLGILKFRLYDIDRIISRTLAYAIVTGLLVGVYAGLVLLVTHVLTVKTPVAVAAATLAAAALFNPLRRRVQRMVDRRFNRSRYDADLTSPRSRAACRTPWTWTLCKLTWQLSCRRRLSPPTSLCG